MKYLIFFLLSFFVQTASAQIKVAVIDTGLNMEVLVTEDVRLCEPVHDLVNDGASDTFQHGSNIASIITRYASGAPHCLVLYKIFKGTTFSGLAYEQALSSIASRTDINILNLSLEGRSGLAFETKYLKQILDRGTTVVAAAGNHSLDLSRYCSVYPACVDPRIYVIGNESTNSNYGKPVDATENGNRVPGGGVILSGTSQAAAIFTGKLVHKVWELKNAKK